MLEVYPITQELMGKRAMESFLSDGLNNVTYEEFQSDDSEVKDKICVCNSVDNRSYNEVQSLIENEYDSIDEMVTTVLCAVQSQLVHEAIEGMLPDDFGKIDMKHLLESGLKQINYQGKVYS